MSNISIEDLGISKEEITERIISAIVDRVMNSKQYDEEGDLSRVEDTKFCKVLKDRVVEKTNEAVDAIAARNVIPNITQYLENFCLEKTNEWGEKKGEKMTFIEYLISRAESYISEMVDHNGKTKAQDSYSWKAHQTRIAFLIDKHLQYSIQTAMEKALGLATSSVKTALEQSVKLALAQITVKVDTTVKTK